MRYALFTRARARETFARCVWTGVPRSDSASGSGWVYYADLAALYGYPSRRIRPRYDPKEHRLMIHGMVDRPVVFTIDELKRFPAVTRFHFIECAGNNARTSHKTVQQSHGLTNTAAWTGVPLSTLAIFHLQKRLRTIP